MCGVPVFFIIKIMMDFLIKIKFNRDHKLLIDESFIDIGPLVFEL